MYRVTNTIQTGTLTPGARVSGVAVGTRKNGRVAFVSTWDGVYAGIQQPDPSDPFIDERGNKHPGDPIHLFRDGHINGIAQTYHGFPVSDALLGGAL